MSVDLISILERRLLAHEKLKEEDQPVVSELCRLIRIEESGEINEYHRSRVEAEAGAVYLKSKYDELLNKFVSLVDRHKASKSVELGTRDNEGLKWTKAGKEDWLIATDPRYSALVEMMRDVVVLHSMVRELSNIVFSRDRKLEQLSINYRREAEADRRAET